MQKTKTVEIEVVCCDTCGEELYNLDHRGDLPRYVSGVYWSPDDGVYCESTCIPQE